jgi:hypothetical protein
MPRKKVLGWLVKPELLHKEHHSRGTGRKRRFPRLKAQRPLDPPKKELV